MSIVTQSLDGGTVEFGDQFRHQSGLFDTSVITRSAREDPIPLGFSMKVLQAVNEWSQHHANDVKPRRSPRDRFAAVKAWDWFFIGSNKNVLTDMTKAANYLEVPKLLELCCKSAVRSLKAEEISELPQELEDMIRVETAHDLIEDLEDWKVDGAYLVCDGIHSERKAKVSELAVGCSRPMFLSDETREGVYLCEGLRTPDIDMNRLREITEAGELIKQPRYVVVPLPTYSRPDLVSCSVTRENTCIVILATAIESHDLYYGRSRLIAAAKTALESELEKVHTRICTITWPKGSSRLLLDCLQCLRIPRAVRILEVRGLKDAFGIPVPTKWNRDSEFESEFERFVGHREADEFEMFAEHADANPGHWIHQVVRTFQHLDKLMLEHMSEDDLMNLGHWFETTKVLQAG